MSANQMPGDARLPDIVYRVAGRYKTTQKQFIESDFCDLKSVQTQVKSLNADIGAQVEYYIDAIRLDQLPTEKLVQLLERGLITQTQLERTLSNLSAAEVQPEDKAD